MQTTYKNRFAAPVIALIIALSCIQAFGQAAGGADVVMVLSFENNSNRT
jgi:hypothetical protein